MRPRSIPVLLALVALAGCGLWGTSPADPPSAPPPSSAVPDDPTRPTLPAVTWQELPREDARLRGLVRDMLHALASDDPQPLEGWLLTPEAVEALRQHCGGTVTEECLPDPPDIIVKDVALDDTTHATIHTFRIENGALVDGPELHALLTRDGARLTGLPQ